VDYFTDIYDYITRQEALYGTGIPVNEKWSWSMKEHILTTELYTNSQLINGKSEWTPVKNITKPILNLEHRTEDIEVKDVQLYVDDPEKYYLSFLVKKYHDDVFVQENDMDTFFDELNVSRIDYGGGLSKKLNKPAPEVVPLQSIAFCDQTDMLSGPIGIKHYYSPDQLLEMEAVGWGNAENGASMSIPDLLTLATHEKKGDNQNQSVKTPGRYVEVYEVHGNLPKRFADPADDSGLYETRLFICAFYQGEGSENKSGAVLYTKLEPQSPFKLIKRDPVYGRALGFGGAEELFEAQVWTNYDMIRIQDMLDAAAKTILKTTDPTVAGKNKLKDMDNLEIIELTQGTDLSQVDTFPRNMKLFETSMAQWEDHAQKMGAATEAVLGESPSAGTPFKLQQEVIKQGLGLHEYRRGQYAKHLEEIYRDWIIPHIQKKICEGTTFLSELSLEEMQYVADALVTNATNDLIKRKVIEGTLVQPDEVAALKEIISGEFKKKGSKHFIEILKGEFKDTPLAVKVSVKGKSKDLSARTDGLVNVFRQIIANPAVLQIPAIAKIFNSIIESSGLDVVDFTGITTAQIANASPGGAQQGVEQNQQPLTQPGLSEQPQRA
jgi:hypothetical protein